MTTVPPATDVRKPLASEARPTAREEMESCAPQRLGELLRDYLVSWTEDFQARLDKLLEATHAPDAARELLLEAIGDLETAAQTSGELIRRTGHEASQAA